MSETKDSTKESVDVTYKDLIKQRGTYKARITKFKDYISTMKQIEPSVL